MHEAERMSLHAAHKAELGKPFARAAGAIFALLQGARPALGSSRPCGAIHGSILRSATTSNARQLRDWHLVLSNVSPERVSYLDGKAAAQSASLGVRAVHDYVLFLANTGLRPDEAAGWNFAMGRSPKIATVKKPF